MIDHKVVVHPRSTAEKRRLPEACCTLYLHNKGASRPPRGKREGDDDRAGAGENSCRWNHTTTSRPRHHRNRHRASCRPAAGRGRSNIDPSRLVDVWFAAGLAVVMEKREVQPRKASPPTAVSSSGRRMEEREVQPSKPEGGCTREGNRCSSFFRRYFRASRHRSPFQLPDVVLCVNWADRA